MIDVRTGLGYDVHVFGDHEGGGNHVFLGGVRMEHSRAIIAHSDGDVVLHALTDALLGAIAAGDIGDHFPPSDPKWKDAASHLFVRHAAELVRDAGFTISNVDCSVIAEAPKIGPHRDAIRTTIADMLDIDMSRVAIKATTNERIGFVGRREGIAAMAVATLIKDN